MIIEGFLEFMTLNINKVMGCGIVLNRNVKHFLFLIASSIHRLEYNLCDHRILIVHFMNYSVVKSYLCSEKTLSLLIRRISRTGWILD